MWRRASLAILMFIGATGCIPQQQRPIAVAPPPAPAPVTPVAPKPPPPPQAAPPLPERKPDSATATAPAVDAKQLVGLTFNETTNLLGLPTKKEEKPPAEVWTYDNEGCELDIFFYADIKTREYRALTYEIKGTQASGGSNDQCLARWTRGT